MNFSVLLRRKILASSHLKLVLLVVLRDPLVLRSGVRNLHSTQCKKLSLSSFASN
jgi:hypothetical protein